MATVSSSSSPPPPPPPTSSPTTAAIPPPTSSSTPPAGTDGGPRQKAMSPQNVPAVTRRPTRSGRLGVDKQGEYTYKNTPSSTLMASLQLGLQVSIGGHEPKPRRDILMTDFEVVETVDFPADGSTITPAHKYRDFTFKTYSPEAFRFFREAFGIIAEEYLLAMCAHPMREISNPGASGSLFYLSADDAFIIKTVQKKEAHFLQKLLPGYYLNLTQNKKTLLPKFFGLYRYKCGTVNIRIVVMNNLLPSTLKYHEKYDLKGSTYKRKAVGDELGKSSPTFKDLDFQEKHTEGGGVHLLSDKYEILMKTLDRDCKVLESFGIMDYSLLLGVHNIDQTKRNGESSSRTNSPSGDGREEDRHFLVPSRIELSKNFSIISVENIPLSIEGEDPSESPPRYPEGYIQGKLRGDKVLVYLGIIDILQSYRLKKKFEHTLKSMITDGNTVSVHNPSYYSRRFYDFLQKTVFVKEKAKARGRKASKLPGGARRVVQTGGVVRTQSMPHSRDRYHSQQHQRRPGAPELSPNSTATFSPPPLTSGESSTTPGKSNLKQSSQFERKKEGPPAETTAAIAETNLLPEIPTMEVLLSSGAEEEGGEGSKVGKTPVKGVRFADEVDEDEEEESEVGGEKQSTERNDTIFPAVSELSTSTKKTAEEEAQEDKDREEMMESVDFDKVTGTSTPISEESPALAKRGLGSPSSADSSSAVEEREEVIVATMDDGVREHQNRETTTTARETEKEFSQELSSSTVAEECSNL